MLSFLAYEWRRGAPMLRSSFLLAFAALLAPGCIAQTKLEGNALFHHPFSKESASGGTLRLRVRSGEIHVIGTGENRISVELSGRNAYDAGNLKVRLERQDRTANMRISGGPRHHLT